MALHCTAERGVLTVSCTRNEVTLITDSSPAKAYPGERRLLERQRLEGGEAWHGGWRVFDSSRFSAFPLGILVNP